MNMTYLNIDDATLEQNNGYWTAKEIAHQPEMWRQTQQILDDNADAINDFIAPLMKIDNLRIILTGAGTSAFAGESIAPDLLKITNKRVEAVATTDLVSGPELYFQKDVPTLVVSFSRSGGSPESMAAIELSEQTIENCYQLVLTCNHDGDLYKRCQNLSNSFALLMPAETHDKSFAMTSSFSSMVYAALMILTGQKNHVNAISDATTKVIEGHNDALKSIADKNFERVVYLGSNGLKGLAREASLKLLELTDGKTVTMFDSPLGFRHGPKTIVTPSTLIFVFISNDPYTRKYDLDLLNEIRTDNEVGQVIAITAQEDENVYNGDYLMVDGLDSAADTDILFPYIVCAQIYAFHHALKLGNTPDSPSLSGTVNRVVQGVTIHSL
ncbi:MAG: SIS domain-containing protein [Kordiimonadaceae bacterium]|jgi:tagatose-6-phosphate ketose/aldose isomerase|nr:SIS domain-containing protein [Kordiimonadaceae bacterium]MBT6031958.1 SIS domain-containing protein [Kordiimonadaceae bacterium]